MLFSFPIRINFIVFQSFRIVRIIDHFIIVLLITVSLFSFPIRIVRIIGHLIIVLLYYQLLRVLSIFIVDYRIINNCIVDYLLSVFVLLIIHHQSSIFKCRIIDHP